MSENNQKITPRPIATFDLTGRCPLRCKHCYFYAAEVETDLEPSLLIAKLEMVRDQYGVRSAFWVGGEPLLRLEVLRLAIKLFDRNAISTSGVLPIPADLDAGLLVSIDGSEKTHDSLRGKGAFNRALYNLRHLPERSFFLSVTLSSMNLDVIEELPRLVKQTRAGSALIGFYVGPKNDPLCVDGNLRLNAVNRLLTLQQDFPEVVANSPLSLMYFLPDHSNELARDCIYHNRAIAFDTHLRPKKPCTFATQASCDSCGCGVVATQKARDNGDTASNSLLRALFPRTRQNTLYHSGDKTENTADYNEVDCEAYSKSMQLDPQYDRAMTEGMGPLLLGSAHK